MLLSTRVRKEKFKAEDHVPATTFKEKKKEST
jgi:hypothetical protein